MAEGTYEYECMRAELLGIDRPNQEEFEKARAERLQREQAEIEAADANTVDTQDETLRNAGGKLDELNSILSSTQQKLNRFKQTACGSLSNMFGRNSVDIIDNQSPSTSATASRRNTTASGGLGSGTGNAEFTKDDDINRALDNLDEMQKQNDPNDIQPIIPTEAIRSAKLDIQKKMGSHLDKLDSLINKAERAEASMAVQTRQMKKLTE